MTLLLKFLLFIGLTLTTISYGEKFSCKQAKRADGSLFFDCGANIPKDRLKIRNTVVIWRTVTPVPPENAYLPPYPINFRPPENLVQVDAPEYANVSRKILNPFLITPILPEKQKPLKNSVPDTESTARLADTLDNINPPRISENTIISDNSVKSRKADDTDTSNTPDFSETTYGRKFACKQTKRDDGSLFFDCGANIPKDHLRMRNTIVIHPTESMSVSENARSSDILDNNSQPDVSKNTITTNNLVNSSPTADTITTSNAETPYAPEFSKNVNTPPVTENIAQVDSVSLNLHESSDNSKRSNPPKRSKITNPTKQAEINNPGQAANIHQPEPLEISNAMRGFESANLISLNSEIDQQTSGQPAWKGLATSIWFFYMYFFLFIFL